MSFKESQISRFFKNQTIFLTGGTGFLGKLLIEKLLRACPDLNKIYVLMRPKRNKTAQERFQEFFNNPCFEKIQKSREKLFLITGDCNEPSLGLTLHDSEILKKETTCIIHAASNVNLTQTLKEASLNVRATKDLIQLAKEMPQLKVLVYVSTAYSNSIHSHIKEEFYQPPIEPETFLQLVDSLDGSVLEKIKPGLLDGWLNSYVYSKCISEHLFKTANLDVPVGIIRPASVINTIEEPVEGWIDNYYNSVGIVVAASLGILPSFHVNKDRLASVIPGDYVSNCTLAVVWKMALEKSGVPKIFNCVGQPISCGDFKEKMLDFYYWKFPSVHYVWYKTFEMRSNKFRHELVVWLNLILAYIIDSVFCFGNSTRIVPKYKAAQKIAQILSFVLRNEWTFDENNVANLWKEMSDVDKKLFNFSMENLDWSQYFRRCFLGTRIYLLKDPIETLPQARRKLKKLFVVHYLIVASFYIFMVLFIKLLLL